MNRPSPPRKSARAPGWSLAQVYGFAKQSGGGVRIETAVGQGTTVRVYLPKAETVSAAGEDLPEITSENSARADGTPAILVVDDNNAVREITSSSLSDLGYLVHEASSGSAALAMLERHSSIDLIVIDFAMPGMNGAEVAREVRRRRRNFPILLVTGFADTMALAQAGETRDRLARRFLPH